MLKFTGVRLACLLGVICSLVFGALGAMAAPRVFWASDPVGPNETVLLQGCDFGDAAVVEAARLDDGEAGSTRVLEIKQWKRLDVLQGGDTSLKFVIPANWAAGVFVCRVSAGGATSAPVLLNAPDPWWVQGDGGESAAPGGWMRVLGKSLNFGKSSLARLEDGKGAVITLKASAADCYALRFDLPGDLAVGTYKVQIHNGQGGAAAWRPAGNVRIEMALPWPRTQFSVLDFYGKDAVRDMRKTLLKYAAVPDRTEGIQAALKKAKENGGGVVFFPAGRYGIKGELSVPPRTLLKGEGMGLVVLWWGGGRFNLDGGGQQGLARGPNEPKLPGTLIFGPEFGIEDLSLYLPLDHQLGISCADHFRMKKVRVRVDHLWTQDGSKRPEGTVARLGKNFQVSDCDIIAKGAGLIPGQYGVVARNKILAGKTHCPLGGCQQVIVEDNEFVSTYPTAYMNISGSARNIYYARNRQEAMQTHQADFSFTFDAGDAAYFGKIAAADGVNLTLAADPVYPKWAQEKSDLWRKAIIVIQDGRGAGQWRNGVANRGREWTIDRAFDCPPDGTSLVTIVPMNGRVLIVGNRFEDANWVNASYGTGIDVICAGNKLYRCAQLLNYGCAPKDAFQPSWYVQYFDNELYQGQTSVDTTGSIHDHDRFPCPITCCTVHRRHVLGEDNSGGISVGGYTRDVIVEGCILRHPSSAIRAEGDAQGVLFRNNVFEGGQSPRYEGKRLGSALVVPGAPDGGRK
jgi:hypothetical protein